MLKINLLDVVSIRRACANRIPVIYLADEKKSVIRNFFYNIGFEECLFAGGEDQDISIHEILENANYYYIWLTDNINALDQANCLNSFGFVYLKDYNYLEGARYQTNLIGTTVLDPNLGHGTASRNFKGYRERVDGSKKISIAVVGASLVDETFFSWKLWPEVLYDSLKTEVEGLDFIFGGCYAYTTSQVYVKLIRDIIPASPDIVIDYCAYENDACYGNLMKTPYVIGMQKKAINKLKRQIDAPFGHKFIMEEVEYGHETEIKTSRVIIDNIIRSHYACDEKGIKYLCVLPPSISTQKISCCDDEELLWAYIKQAKTVSEICNEMKEMFSDEMREYIIDGRSWMDDYPGVFYDQFHMYEYGNTLIADKIYNILRYEKGFI